MKNLKHNQDGFSAVEIILVLIIVTLLGAIGWYVYNQSKNKTPDSMSVSTSSAPQKTTETDPYAGWKSYTLVHEKASFKYPSDWTLKDTNTDPVMSDMDSIELKAPSGASLTISAHPAGGYGGDESKIDGSDTLKFTGQSYYLVYTSYPDPNDGTKYNTTIDSAYLSTSTAEKYKFPPAKNNITNADSFTQTTEFSVYFTFPEGKAPATITAARADADLKNAKLVLESVTYE